MSETSPQTNESNNTEVVYTVDSFDIVAAMHAKNEILEKAKQLLPVWEYNSFSIDYERIIHSFFNYSIRSTQKFLATSSQVDAYKAKKIDPAIAGGVASGIAGVGAGVYTGVTQQLKNQQIDEARKRADEWSMEASRNKTASASNYDRDINKVMSVIQKYPELQRIYDEGVAYSKEQEEKRKQEEEKNKSNGGCYVATAVYGSYDCPQVWTLRRYRDNTLAETWYGRAFIHSYYAVSPTLVKWFGETAWFKKMWKSKLDRMVMKLNEKGIANTPYQDRNW